MGLGNRLGLAYALGYRALIAVEAGVPAEAEPRLQALEELRDDPAVAEHFVTFAGDLARAALAERAGRYEAASTELARAAAVAERGAGRTEIAHVKVALGQVQWARRGPCAGGSGARSTRPRTRPRPRR